MKETSLRQRKEIENVDLTFDASKKFLAMNTELGAFVLPF